LIFRKKASACVSRAAGYLTNCTYRGDTATLVCYTLFTKMWLSSVEQNLRI